MLGNDTHAEDVLQDTNVYIWQNIGHYDPAKGEFIAWATTMATFQVRRFRRDAERERARLVYDTDVFDALAQILAAPAPAGEGETDRTLRLHQALHECLKKLDPDDLELVRRRYYRDEPFEALANFFHATAGALRVRVCRLRTALNNCITGKMCVFHNPEGRP